MSLLTVRILRYYRNTKPQGAIKPPRDRKKFSMSDLGVIRTVPVRRPNSDYRTREHLTESEINLLLDTLKSNRHGKRDWLIGLVIFRHGLRASELCDLQWTDIDFSKSTVIIRRLKGSIDSNQYLTRDEIRGLKELKREAKSHFVFINERGNELTPAGLNRMFQRAGEAAKLPIKVHTHAIRHSTGYALAARGMDTRRLQHMLGHKDISNTVKYTAMSPEPFKNIWD